MCFGKTKSTKCSHLFLRPVIMEISALSEGNLFHKFWRNANFYLTNRNLSVDHVEPIFRYLKCLMEFGEMVLP